MEIKNNSAKLEGLKTFKQYVRAGELLDTYPNNQCALHSSTWKWLPWTWHPLQSLQRTIPYHKKPCPEGKISRAKTKYLTKYDKTSWMSRNTSGKSWASDKTSDTELQQCVASVGFQISELLYTEGKYSHNYLCKLIDFILCLEGLKFSLSTGNWEKLTKSKSMWDQTKIGNKHHKQNCCWLEGMLTSAPPQSWHLLQHMCWHCCLLWRTTEKHLIKMDTEKKIQGTYISCSSHIRTVVVLKEHLLKPLCRNWSIKIK